MVRNLDDEVVERLKALAAAEKKSLEQTLRDVLTKAAKPSRAEVIAELDRIRAMTTPHPPGAPLAEDLIREDRDNR